jgi:hypothetical protein
MTKGEPLHTNSATIRTSRDDIVLEFEVLVKHSRIKLYLPIKLGSNLLPVRCGIRHISSNLGHLIPYIRRRSLGVCWRMPVKRDWREDGKLQNEVKAPTLPSPPLPTTSLTRKSCLPHLYAHRILSSVAQAVALVLGYGSLICSCWWPDGRRNPTRQGP